MNWFANVWPRLLSVYRRARSESAVFQTLTDVQEARTALEYAEHANGALVQDWCPEELRRDALQHLRLAEARLRKMSGDY